MQADMIAKGFMNCLQLDMIIRLAISIFLC